MKFKTFYNGSLDLDEDKAFNDEWKRTHKIYDEESTKLAKTLGLTHFGEWIWKDKDGKRWLYKVRENKFVKLDTISEPKNKIPKNW